jgi:hypothetical protein
MEAPALPPETVAPPVAVAPTPDDGLLTVFVMVMKGLLTVAVAPPVAPVPLLSPVKVMSKKPPLPVEDEVASADDDTTELGVDVTVMKGKKKFRLRADSTGVLASRTAARTMQHVAAKRRAMLLWLKLMKSVCVEQLSAYAGMVR